jgi:hypothetical protein
MSNPALAFEVAESIHGTWFYHIRRPGEFKSLCGREVMSCGIPMSDWGVKTHLDEGWCSKCQRLMAEAA